MNDISGRVNRLAEGLEEASWFTNLGEESLASIKRTLVLAHGIAMKMLVSYVKYANYFHKHKLDLRAYREAADSLKEAAVDLENRFFVFPQDKDMQDLAQQFADL